MASVLEFKDQATIESEVKSLLEAKNLQGWLIVGFVSKGAVALESKGTGGVDEMKQHLKGMMFCVVDCLDLNFDFLKM